MSTRMQRKRRKNQRRCRNCGEFGHHYVPWAKAYACDAKPNRPLYPGEWNRRGEFG